MSPGLESIEDGAVVEVGVREDAIDAPANAAKFGYRTFLKKKRSVTDKSWVLKLIK